MELAQRISLNTLKLLVGSGSIAVCPAWAHSKADSIVVPATGNMLPLVYHILVVDSTNNLLIVPAQFAWDNN